MNIQGQSQKYGHLIVAGGTIIALIGFFFLPYVTMTSTAGSTISPSSSSSSTTTWSALQAASFQGFIWLDALLAAGILLVALLLAYSHNPFGTSRVALEKQVQRGIYAVIGIGVLSLLLQYILMATIPGALASMFSSNIPGYTTSISSSVSKVAMSYNTGSWFYVVGMLAVIGGAIYALMQMRPAQVAPSSYMPPTQYSQNQQSPWQQPPAAPTYQDPVQSQPTQLSQGQYPNQQQWQQPQPPTNYPPVQQAWQQPPQQQPPQQQAWQQPPQQQPPQQQAWQQPPQQQPPYPPTFPGQ